MNAVVASKYAKRGNVQGVDADCTYIEKNADGSEYWVCDVAIEGPLFDADTCNVHVRRSQVASISARVTYCINDDFGP